jgi:hypothetical protein
MSVWSARGGTYQRAAVAFLRVHTVCWLCAHPASDSIDHYIPVSVAPWLRYVVANWRPSHGVKGCPTCGRKCNQSRGNKPGLPQSRRSRRW